MSHVASQDTKAGEPLFADLACLRKAADMKGFKVVDTPHYNWYNRYMGDYQKPEVMKIDELGHNALFILRMKEPARSKYRHSNGCDPYDIGIIADPNNPGCYTLVYDFYHGGYGIDELLGAPVRDGNGIKMLCPELKQTYDMVCDAAAAAEVGDVIEFLNRKQAHEKYPVIFSASDDEKTWVSIANTESRIGVS